MSTRKNGMPLLLSSILCMCSGVISGSEYIMQVSDLHLWCSAPPAAVFVTDRAGNMSGVDVNRNISSRGLGTILENIPRSEVENTVSARDSGSPLSASAMAASWKISIMDGGDQEYVVTLVGTKAGVASIHFTAMQPRRVVVRPFVRKVLIGVDQRREMRVTFSPSRGFDLTVEPVVTLSSLGDDVKVACALGMIQPGGICDSLKAKTDTATHLSGNGNAGAASGSINAFLNELKAQGGKHIHEPALTILREEAEALLKTLPAAQKPKGSAKK